MQSMSPRRPHPSRLRREFPAEPLQPEAVKRWLGGGSYYGKPPRPLGHRLQNALGVVRALEEDPRAERARARGGERAAAELLAAATEVLCAGLRQRVPAWAEWGVILRLDAGEWRTYRGLVELGAECPRGLGGRAPAGVGVCEDCHGVFRPSRKARAFKCPRCHATPKPPARFEPFRTTIAVDELDDAGEPVGWRVRHHFYCARCREPLDAQRVDHRYCSGRCKTAAHRERARARTGR